MLGVGALASCSKLHLGNGQNSQNSPAAGASAGQVTSSFVRLVSGDGSIQNVPALDSVELPAPIQLTDLSQGGRPLYLVWPAVYSGLSIEQVDFNFQRTGADGRVVDLSGQIRVIRDFATSRWYVPLSEAFAGQETELSPADQQVLSLDFRLSDQSHVSLQTTFSLQGWPPDQVMTRDWLASTGSEAPADAYADLAAGKYAYETTEFANPTPRPLLVWIRVRSFGLSEQTIVGHERFSLDPNTMQPNDAGIDPLSWPDRALAFAGIQSGEEWTPAALNQWVSFPLPPLGHIQLNWVAGFPSGEVACRLPVPDTVTVLGCTLIHVLMMSPTGAPTCIPMPPGPNNLDTLPPIQVSAQSHWSIAGVQFTGSVARDIWITEAEETAEGSSLPLGHLVHVDGIAAVPTGHRLGFVPEGSVSPVPAAPAPCQ